MTALPLYQNAGRVIVTLPNTQLLSISFRPDGYLLVAGYGSGQTRIWRLEQIGLS
ncbi:MAG TPA: hypothetical protein VFV38_49980 [Ktedonobacteraceae bacterium]|nr:hypothetical protein [Ktedonobacteraceae bacterium]